MPTPAEIIAGDISSGGLKKSELLSKVREILTTHGVCVVRGILDANVIKALRDAAQERMYELQRLLLLKSTFSREGSVEVRFKEAVERDGGRCDMRLNMHEEPFRSFKQTPFLQELGETLLGADMIEQFYGVVTALGRKSVPYCDLRSTGAQQWHQDGGSLFHHAAEDTVPIHCVNLFFPLVDVAEKQGATEFLLGSHTCSNYETEIQPRLEKSEHVIVDEKAGSIILFDYRTWHRGGEHTGVDDRHVLYLTFSKPWFVDHKNHRSTVSIYDSSSLSSSFKKRKHETPVQQTSRVESFDGIDLWPTRTATVEALEWKREGRSDAERYDKQFQYATDSPGKVFTLDQSREGICSTVWDASIVLAKYFEAHPEHVQGNRCLGLGSGCGLTELVAMYLGASSMCATDITSALPLLEANLKLHPIEGLHVKELEWGLTQSLSEVKSLAPFDVIIGADIVYVEASGTPLVETLDALMGPTTRICLAYGRNRQYLSEFLKAAKGRGIRFKQVPYDEHHHSYRSADIDIIWGQREQNNPEKKEAS